MNLKIIALAKYLDLNFCKFGLNDQEIKYYIGISQEDFDEKEEELLSDERYSREEINDILFKWLDDETVLLEDEFIESSYDDCIFEYEKEEYLICTDSEADDRAFESVSNLWEDCYVTKEMRESFLYHYIDFDAATEAAIQADGRANTLASYDGEENEEEVDGETYYIYRTN